MSTVDLNVIGDVTYRDHDDVNFQNFDGSLNVVYLNARSLRNKIERIELLIHSFADCVVHVVVVAETWIRPGEEDLFELDGYRSHHSVRVNTVGGGVSIYVLEELNTYECYELYEDECNYVVVKLIDYNKHIVGYYRPGSSTFSIFINRMMYIMRQYTNTQMIGDANVDLLKTSAEVDEYLTVVYTGGYFVMNKINENFYTRSQSAERYVLNDLNGQYEQVMMHTRTIIDHFITDDVNGSKTLTWFHSADFDHCYAVLNMKIQTSDTQEVPTRQIIDFNRAKNLFSNRLNDVNSIEDFSRVLEECVELSKRTVEVRSHKNARQPWMTEEILRLMRTRDYMCRERARHPDNHQFNVQFKHMRNRVNAAIRDARRTYTSEQFASTNGDARKFWRVINEVVFGKRHNKNSLISLRVNDVITSEGRIVANALNKAFTQGGQPHPNINRQYNAAANQQDILFKFPTISRELVDNLLQNMNSGASAGLDGVTVRLLRQLPPICLDKLVDVLQDMFNRSVFPPCLKRARTVAIFKKGDPLDEDNYRGVAVLPAVARFPEMIMNTSLSDYIYQHKLLSANQFGFTRKSNTLAAVASLTTFIRQKLDEGLRVGVIFLDLRKAFDCVDHTLLVNRLRDIGVIGPELEMFQDYLRDRESIVEANGVRSEPLAVRYGVPQGSIPSPTLFNVFLDPALNIETGGHAQCFADDKAIVFFAHDIGMLFRLMQRGINLVIEYLERNGLHYNAAKTVYMIMRHLRTEHGLQPDHILRMGHEIIKRVAVAKYLGCWIDETLSFGQHIDKILAKLRSNLFALRRSRHLLTERAAWNLYHAHINSHISHLCPIYTTASKQRLRSIEVIQSRALRIVMNKQYDCSRSLLYSEKILPLRLASIFETIFLVYKIIHGKIHHNFELVQTREIHSHHTRNTNDFRLYRFRTQMGAQSILANGLRLFNDLPEFLKDDMPISRFKKLLKSHIWNTTTNRYYDQPDY